ncbi:MAG: hypothetical protein K6E16_03085 [Lachnospiraceae bacterium]|nr:hypothetical protein [Lachnospiraceae bacterium]
MSWFVLSLITMLGWGFADLFYKKGTDEEDGQSHLKIAVWVGLVMGACALILLPFTETSFSLSSFLTNAVKYSPASLAYILSMVIGYAGLRYLEVSIISPVQNASGAFSMIVMLVYFAVTGTLASFWEEFAWLDVIGTVLIIIGVVALAILEHRWHATVVSDNKYRFSALALLFPIAYCLFDTIGTAADGIILDDNGLGLGEIDVLVLYGLTFFAAGILAYLYMLIRNRKLYNPFAASERNKCFAALFEECGQIFYVYAMASRPILAAPLVASYCIVSVILSRIFIKEKLKGSQYACVFTVITGIVLLGISEGLNS